MLRQDCAGPEIGFHVRGNGVLADAPRSYRRNRQPQKSAQHGPPKVRGGRTGQGGTCETGTCGMTTVLERTAVKTGLLSKRRIPEEVV